MTPTDTRTKVAVKICGVGHPDEVDACIRAGVAAVGLMFVRDSPRLIDRRRAIEILAGIRLRQPASVFVYKDQPASFIRDGLSLGKPDYLQFHGKESPQFCRQFKIPYIKACGIERYLNTDGGIDVQALSAYYRDYAGAAAILLDGKNAGSGRVWSWRRLPAGLLPRTIIAGGLNAQNVESAIRLTGSRSIDLSSGVESSPGRKSAELIEQLMRKIRCYSKKLETATEKYFHF